IAFCSFIFVSLRYNNLISQLATSILPPVSPHPSGSPTPYRSVVFLRLFPKEPRLSSPSIVPPSTTPSSASE
ncbi:hypothetical protein C7212DRAFT_313800, partial [Tuber magnatum]